MQATSKAVAPKQLAAALLTLWGRLMRGHEGSVFELFDELGVTVTQIKALQVLANCTDELSVKELSDRLSLSLPAASRTIDALLKRGWVERREDERDRRMKRVRIADDGRAVAERILNARMEGLEDFAASLTPSQRAALHAAITAID